MAELEFRNLRKVFAGGAVAVESLDLVVADGEFLVLVGPSGSGKTTVLRMAAGLERASSGDVLIGGEVVNDVAPPHRDIAMGFQTYALYPHMTAYDNMAFGLKLHGLKKGEIRPRVQSAAKMLELDELLKRKPSQLSGGQRPRGSGGPPAGGGEGGGVGARPRGLPHGGAALEPRREAARRDAHLSRRAAP